MEDSRTCDGTSRFIAQHLTGYWLFVDHHAHGDGGSQDQVQRIIIYSSITCVKTSMKCAGISIHWPARMPDLRTLDDQNRHLKFTMISALLMSRSLPQLITKND